MCALWTKDTYPDDPDLLKVYLPRNLSRTSPPNMHRLYLWREPPIHNLCAYDSSASLYNNNCFFSSEELLDSSCAQSNSSLFHNQAIINKPQVLSHQNCSNGFESDRDVTAIDKVEKEDEDENSTSYVTINFQTSNPSNDTGSAANTDVSGEVFDSDVTDKTRLSPIYQENEFENLNTFVSKRRSSSLRSVKDSATTPVRKAVRFADAFGLDLVKVKNIFSTDSTSNVSLTDGGQKRKLNYFVLGFSLSNDKEKTYHEALSKCLILEDCMVDKNTLTGTIRVRSLTPDKQIFVRITYDNWSTFSDIQAYYVQDSFDGMTDRFSFVIILPKGMPFENKIAFAICYNTSDGQSFWDNNHGSNYTIDSISRSVGSNTWMHFI